MPKPLMVRVPRSVANNAIMTSQLRRLGDLKGWSLVYSSATVIRITKMDHSEERSEVLMTLNISNGRCSLAVGTRAVPNFERPVSSTHAVLSVLGELNEVAVCHGIEDAKYSPIVEKHNGQFHDPTGEFSSNPT